MRFSKKQTTIISENIFRVSGCLCRVVKQNYNVNLLCAKSNLKLLTQQINKFKPKYAFLYDHKKFTNLNYKIGKTKLINLHELNSYLLSSKSTPPSIETK